MPEVLTSATVAASLAAAHRNFAISAGHGTLLGVSTISVNLVSSRLRDGLAEHDWNLAADRGHLRDQYSKAASPGRRTPATVSHRRDTLIGEAIQSPTRPEKAMPDRRPVVSCPSAATGAAVPPPHSMTAGSDSVSSHGTILPSDAAGAGHFQRPGLTSEKVPLPFVEDSGEIDFVAGMVRAVRTVAHGAARPRSPRPVGFAG